MKKSSRTTYRLRRTCIRIACNERFWNLAQLADKADVSPSTISYVISQGKAADHNTVESIAKALGVEPKTLIVTKTQRDCPKDSENVLVPTIQVDPIGARPSAELAVQVVEAMLKAMGYPPGTFKLELYSPGSLIITISADADHFTEFFVAFLDERLTQVTTANGVVAQIVGFTFSEDDSLTIIARPEKFSSIYEECYYARIRQRSRFTATRDSDGVIHLQTRPDYRPA